MNPKTLKPFVEAYRLRLERENEARSSELDVSAWYVGLYVRDAIVSAFNHSAKYPNEPYTVSKRREEQMTAQDHADMFRQFLKHYRRPAVKGGGK